MSGTVEAVVCAECHAESFPPFTEAVHEPFCSRSPQNRARPVTVDGKTGRLIVDPPQPPLVELSLDEMIGVVAEMQGKVVLRKSERGRASKALHDAQKARDDAMDALVGKWRESHGLEPLPFPTDEEEEGE